MKFKARVTVMPHNEILDPQGKAVSKSMKNIGLPQIDHVRIGKHITLEVEADNKEKATEMVDQACKKLLANQIMEYYSFQLEEMATSPA
ncbi:MAG: phosphoribosylformylglycinamidine synthase subunit PurS [Bacteroidia bacterium]